MQGERTYARLIQFCTWCMVALSPAGVSADYFARVAMQAQAKRLEPGADSHMGRAPLHVRRREAARLWTAPATERVAREESAAARAWSPELQDATLLRGLMTTRLDRQPSDRPANAPAALIALGAGAIAGGIGLSLVEENVAACADVDSRRAYSGWSRCRVHPYGALGAATIFIGCLSSLSGIEQLLRWAADSQQGPADGRLRVPRVLTTVMPWVSPSTRGLQAYLTF